MTIPWPQRESEPVGWPQSATESAPVCRPGRSVPPGLPGAPDAQIPHSHSPPPARSGPTASHQGPGLPACLDSLPHDTTAGPKNSDSPRTPLAPADSTSPHWRPREAWPCTPRHTPNSAASRAHSGWPKATRSHQCVFPPPAGAHITAPDRTPGNGRLRPIPHGGTRPAQPLHRPQRPDGLAPDDAPLWRVWQAPRAQTMPLAA